MWEGGVFNNFPPIANQILLQGNVWGSAFPLVRVSLSLSLSLSQICHWPWNFKVVQQWECIAQAMDHPSIYMLPSCNNNSQTRERERMEIMIQGGDDIVDLYNTSAIGCTTTLKSLIEKDPCILHKISWQKCKIDPLTFTFFHFSPLSFSFVI